MFDPYKMQNETDASHDYVASVYIVRAFFINLFGCHHALTELCRLFAIGYFFIVYILLKDFLMNSQNFIFIDTFMDIYNFTITAFSNFPNYGIWWGDAIAHSHRNLFGINYYQVLSFYILQVFVGGLQQSGSTQCRPLITWVKQQVWVTPTTADNIHRAALCQRAESLAIFAVSDEPL